MNEYLTKSLKVVQEGVDKAIRKPTKCKYCEKVTLTPDRCCVERTGRNTTTKALNHIRNWAEKISSNWNGDEAGAEEDRATTATEMITKVDELQDLIWEMEEMGVTL